MIAALLASALAGSITLDVELSDAATTEVDFGQVSLGYGTAKTGRRFDGDDSTYLVVDVTATATWTATRTAPAAMPSARRASVFGSMFAMTRTVDAPRTAMVRPDQNGPPTTVDLYVQTQRDRGDAVLWVGPSGTRWGRGSGVQVMPTPTQVASGIPLDVPYTHELALEITRRSEGMQQKELLYTVIVP